MSRGWVKHTSCLSQNPVGHRNPADQAADQKAEWDGDEHRDTKFEQRIQRHHQHGVRNGNSIPLELVERKQGKMNRAIRNEARELVQQGQQAQPVLITEAHLQALPEVVQRYLRYSQVVGKETIRTVRLKQIGRIRQSAQQPWMSLDAEEYYCVNPPGFLWVGIMRKAGLPLVRAWDRYRDGKGNMQIKLGTIFTLANAMGEEMDQGSMTRYLSEMIWFPTAFLGPNVSFEPMDQTSARVTLTDLGKQVTGNMYFDEKGRLTDFVAPRYREVSGKYELETWSTPITGYGEYEGLKLPVEGKAVWKLKEGDLEYIDVAIPALEYNVTTPY